MSPNTLSAVLIVAFAGAGIGLIAVLAGAFAQRKAGGGEPRRVPMLIGTAGVGVTALALATLLAWPAGEALADGGGLGGTLGSLALALLIVAFYGWAAVKLLRKRPATRADKPE